MTLPEGKQIYSTLGEDVIASTERTNIERLAPCSHEEADTRLMIHALDAALTGNRRIRIRSNDTDVVVLAISVANTLPSEELWVTYGTGKNVTNIPAHEVVASLGPSKATALSMCHALTGCDTVSFFGGRQKSTAWDVWSVYPKLAPGMQGIICCYFHPRSITIIFWILFYSSQWSGGRYSGN